MQRFRANLRLAAPAAAGMALLLSAAPACGDAGEEVAAPVAARVVGLIRIQLPLVGNADRLYQSRLQRVVERLTNEASGADRRPLLVLEFTAADGAAASEFERALSLARYLAGPRMAAVKTLAYVPEPLEGHAVLVALACEEIAMAPDAEIGRAAASEDPAIPLEAGIRASYRQIAETRRTAPPPIALAMVDPAVELLRVETDGGVVYALADELEALEAERAVIDKEVLSAAGAAASFTGRDGRELGFVKYLAADRDALARALAVAPGALAEDQSTTDAWRPVMIDLDGPLTPGLARRIETLIGNELEQNEVNWVGLRINSSGGDWQAALRLAQALAELDEGSARTVAYVPRRAEGPAALVALACEQLVMQNGATIGGAVDAGDPGLDFEWGADDAAGGGDPAGDDQAEENGAEDNRAKDNQAEEEQAENQANDAGPPARRLGGGGDEPADARAERDASLDPVVATIRESLAPVAGRTWSLLAATADPAIEVALYSNRRTAEVRAMSPEELAAEPNAGDWRRGEVIVAEGERLALDSDRAEGLGVAWQVVDQFDDLAPLYGFDAPPRTAEPNWALELVEALGSPGFAAMLLVIGVIGVYIELSTPGLGIGGFLSAVAFLLFFWSKFLNGTADWLEVLLFVTGVVFVLMEVLVLPGVGVFGLGGALLIIGSLVLASQTFVLPKTETQLTELRNSLGVVAGAGVMCMIAGMVLRHYLPQSPLFRRAMLMPPDEADRIEQDRREAMVDYTHLVGQSGTATTDLAPSGRAEIAGELLDVMADGEVIDRGETVEVVESRGSRVVVRRVGRA